MHGVSLNSKETKCWRCEGNIRPTATQTSDHKSWNCLWTACDAHSTSEITTKQDIRYRAGSAPTGRRQYRAMSCQTLNNIHFDNNRTHVRSKTNSTQISCRYNHNTMSIVSQETKYTVHRKCFRHTDAEFRRTDCSVERLLTAASDILIVSNKQTSQQRSRSAPWLRPGSDVIFSGLTAQRRVRLSCY